MGLSFATFQSDGAILVFITWVLVICPMEQEILRSFRTWAAGDSASLWLHDLGTLDHFHNLILYIFSPIFGIMKNKEKYSVVFGT